MPDAAPSRSATPASPAATLVGFGAILTWSTLAVATGWTGAIPPLELVTLSFLVAFLLAVAKWSLRREPAWRYLRQPRGVWILSVAGLGVYHALIFLALKTAPPVEANLINYLWPLLIVLFSAALPGDRLRWFHIVGALVAFAGVALLIAGGSGASFTGGPPLGYAAALAAALTWSGYSVLLRRYRAVPTDSVGWFCLGAAVVCGVGHLAAEVSVMPTAAQWAVVVALGAGPVGGAFFLWDYGVKHGNVRTLGLCAFAAPLLSTLLLVAVGGHELTVATGAAAALIVGGAVLGTSDKIRKR